MIPSLFDSAFRCLIFPAERAMNLSYPHPPKICLRSLHVTENLRLQRLWTFKLFLIAHPAQELQPDPAGRFALQRIQQEGLNGKLVLSAEGRPVANVGDRTPAPRAAGFTGPRDVNSARRNHLRFGSEVEHGNRLLRSDSVPAHDIAGNRVGPSEHAARAAHLSGRDQLADFA